MSLDFHPLSVTLIDRDLPLASIQVPAGFPSPAADNLEDTVHPFKWVKLMNCLTIAAATP